MRLANALRQRRRIGHQQHALHPAALLAERGMGLSHEVELLGTSLRAFATIDGEHDPLAPHRSEAFVGERVGAGRRPPPDAAAGAWTSSVAIAGTGRCGSTSVP